MRLFPEIFFILMALFFAGAVQGTTGFGFGLTAIALLSTFLSVKNASLLLLLAGLSLNSFLFWRLRHFFEWQGVRLFFIFALLAVPFGALFLIKADHSLLKRVLGALLLLALARPMLPRSKKQTLLGGIPLLGPFFGLLAGLLAGALATAGPPAVVYLHSRPWPHFRYMATLQLLFGACAVVRLFFFGINAGVPGNIWTLSAMGIVAAVAGAALGLYFSKALPQKTVKIAVSVMLGLLALKYLFF